MKTDELIALLATGTAPVDGRATARRFGSALGAAAVASTLLMAAWLRVRSDLAQASTNPMLWVKLAFPALLAAGGLAATLRLGRPGAGLGRIPAGIAAPVLALWAPPSRSCLPPIRRGGPSCCSVTRGTSARSTSSRSACRCSSRRSGQ